MEILKLQPVFKDYLWGGTRLADDFGYETDMRPVAEGWVLSCHKDGKNKITGGEFDGRYLDDVIKSCSRQTLLGSRAAKFDYFPILIKLIDAKDKLSIQVHPDDAYAKKVENEYGKTEMWYVLDANDGAELIYGFKDKITKSQFKAAIENGTLTDVLNKVKVKKGDLFFIEAGTVHAIGAGILVAEIQQNSNSTYRVYDYGRLKDGKPRELHIDKALDVAVTDTPKYAAVPDGAEEISGQCRRILLKKCPLFTVYKYALAGNTELEAGAESFEHILILDGRGEIDGAPFKKGDSFFVPANYGKYTISGECEFLKSKI
ncbi:MAG: class I mannose-6-phosphate isomerase [Clostridiales bacterium]|nr:class I mannose-6-phosphate isomerase [Clostridiales bacterium]